jgi:hypothetical protein
MNEKSNKMQDRHIDKGVIGDLEKGVTCMRKKKIKREIKE